MPHVLPRERWAFTPPFHPYLVHALGGLFSVERVRHRCLPGVTWNPALWSPDFPLGSQPSDYPRYSSC